jgi:glycerophosphoryl diester phosphodiesterase
MIRSDNALPRNEQSASSLALGDTFLASTASTGGESSCVRGQKSLPKEWPVGPVNMAHRGGSEIGPENTLEGFQEGLLAGANVLELDVRLTTDLYLVVIHDADVKRTTNGTGLVRNMTLQEVKRLDAGYDFTDDRGKTYTYRGRGVFVPTLDEVYQAFPDVPLNVEIKEAQEGIERELWHEIKEADAEHHTLVVSKNMRVICRFREVSGGRVATGASGKEMGAFIIWSHLYRPWSLRPSYQALQVWKGMVTPGLVRAAHRSDLRVDVWTANEEEDMRRLLRYGPDGIMTDRPDRLNRVLER